MERPSDPAVEKAAEDYRAKRDARMAQTKLEVEAKGRLIDLMKAKNLKSYRYEGENGEGETVEFEVLRDSKESVKVKTAKDGDVDDDADPDEEDKD